MHRFDDLESCTELTAEHAAIAASSSESMRRFLEWASVNARPDDGAPKVLQAIAKLAEASWIEGTLYIDLAGDDFVTKISIFVDYGVGLRERLLPLARLSAPFDEFVRAVRVAPWLIAPLNAEHLAASLVLRPAARSPGQALGAIAIAESSLLVTDALTKPPPSGIQNAVTKAPPPAPKQSGVHTHPTVPRMVAVTPDAVATGAYPPRRERKAE